MRTLFALMAALALACPPAAMAAAPVCADCVKATMAHLADDTFKGRKCGTQDEHAAADYIAGELKRYGAAPAFKDGYLQPVELDTTVLAAPAVLSAGGVHWTVGKEIAALGRVHPAQGELVVVTDPAKAPADLKGKVVFYDVPMFDDGVRRALISKGAALVIVPAFGPIIEHWDEIAVSAGSETKVVGVEGRRMSSSRGFTLVVRPEALAPLRALAGGSPISFEATYAPPMVRITNNVVGVIHGTAPDADQQAVLLSAHYDHLGVRGGVIFHGANDDASGTAAVLEFARMLGAGAKPRRTVYFALFGCEEEGGLGASFYRSHTPTPLADLKANLEFEMIGAKDPKHPDALMMTGWERSNLGPTLAQHGAKIEPDFYPEQNFFTRSDNYELALQGVVAHTVSGWAVTPTYHDASDDLAHVDFPYMNEVIASFVEPVKWLVNSDFVPAWNEGKKP